MHEFESFIYYHNNNPKWNETFKVSHTLYRSSCPLAPGVCEHCLSPCSCAFRLRRFQTLTSDLSSDTWLKMNVSESLPHCISHSLPPTKPQPPLHPTAREKVEKSFSFAYMKIMKDDGSIIEDGTHDLFVYEVCPCSDCVTLLESVRVSPVCSRLPW